ncbi:MAG TPA: signal peptidase I [Gemmatimonadales bacterium]|nr:signal peptidase I [Gemmatimonadales bacterium]
MSGAAPRDSRHASTLREWAKSLAIAFVAWLFLRTFVIQAFHIPSPSMENTLLVGDVLFVAKPTYGIEVPLLGVRLPGFREPRRGDIVIFDSVEEEGLEVVKRVIGVPGDTLAMKDGQLYRNGEPVAEPYAQRNNPAAPDAPELRLKMASWQRPRLIGPPPERYDPDRNNWGPVVVPPDSLFVMGDNRDDSLDSRFWGFLPRRNVRGSPLLIYYSWDKQSWRPLPFLTAVRWGRLFTVPR